MKVIKRVHRKRKPKRTASSGATADGMSWESIPRWHVTKSVLAEYLSLVSQAAEAAINKQASDAREEAARALAVGFGVAMVNHGRTLNAEGYEQGDFECKASLGLLGDDGRETARYHRMRAETDTPHRAEREAEYRPLE